MRDEETERLDITASFDLGAKPVNAETIMKVVEELAGKDFFKTLIRADDFAKWYEIGRGSSHKDRQCIILVNGDLIRDGTSYTRITVKYASRSVTGSEYSVGYVNFAESVLTEVRKFRDEIKKKLLPARLRKRG